MPLLRRGSSLKSPFLIILFFSFYFLLASAQNTDVSNTSESTVTATESDTSTSTSTSTSSLTSESTKVSSTSTATPTITPDSSIPEAPAAEPPNLVAQQASTIDPVTPAGTQLIPLTTVQTNSLGFPPQIRTTDTDLPESTLPEPSAEPNVKVELPASTDTFTSTITGSPRTGRRIPFTPKFVNPKLEPTGESLPPVPLPPVAVPPQQTINSVPPVRPLPSNTKEEEEEEEEEKVAVVEEEPEETVSTRPPGRRMRTIASRDSPSPASSTSFNDPPSILTSQKPSPVSPLPSIKPRPEDTPASFSPIVTPPSTLSDTPPKFTAPSEMETENQKNAPNSASAGTDLKQNHQEENVSLRVAQTEEGETPVETPPTSSSKTTTIIAAAAASSVFLLSGVSGILFFYRRKRSRPSSTATFASTISIMDERGLSLEEEQIYTVHIPYIPELEDELKLSLGDQVIIQERFQDKWVLGTNLTTGDSGCFPILCLDEDAASSIPSEFGSVYSMDRNTMSEILSQRSYSLNLRNSGSTDYSTDTFERDTHVM